MFISRTYSTTSCIVVTVPFFWAQHLVLKYSRDVHRPQEKLKGALGCGLFANVE